MPWQFQEFKGTRSLHPLSPPFPRDACCYPLLERQTTPQCWLLWLPSFLWPPLPFPISTPQHTICLELAWSRAHRSRASSSSYPLQRIRSYLAPTYFENTIHGFGVCLSSCSNFMWMLTGQTLKAVLPPFLQFPEKPRCRVCFISAILMDVKWHPNVVLICSSLVTMILNTFSYTELFILLWWSIQVFCPFWKLGCLFSIEF